MLEVTSSMSKIAASTQNTIIVTGGYTNSSRRQRDQEIVFNIYNSQNRQGKHRETDSCKRTLTLT